MMNSSHYTTCIKDIINDLNEYYESSGRQNFLPKLYNKKLLDFYKSEMPPRNIILTDNLANVTSEISINYIIENEIVVIILYFDAIEHYSEPKKKFENNTKTRQLLKTHFKDANIMLDHNNPVRRNTIFSKNIGMPDYWTRTSKMYANAKTFNVLDLRKYCKSTNTWDTFIQDIEKFKVFFNTQ
uniref:Uncharacterized protein n=1 Tax=Drosophila-associated filamentous virus TaxID=2743186 RepID=A0A6M9U073_9VIRU|nr:putative protein 61 [Drosophila-associated filamentous virus]